MPLLRYSSESPDSAKTIFCVCGLAWILLLSECRSHMYSTDLRFQLYDSSLRGLSLFLLRTQESGRTLRFLFVDGSKSWPQLQVFIRCQACGLFKHHFYSPSLFLLKTPNLSYCSISTPRKFSLPVFKKMLLFIYFWPYLGHTGSCIVVWGFSLVEDNGLSCPVACGVPSS